jgi:hypothetical protein
VLIVSQIAALLAASPLLQVECCAERFSHWIACCWIATDMTAVQSNHAKLVPVVVSYQDFWRRYLFRELRLREREQERERLIFKVMNLLG